MERILVPCDFSDEAINAFRLAIDVAHASSAEIHLLHIIELPVMHGDVLTLMSPSFDEKLVVELKERAEAKFSELKQDYSKENVLVQTKIEFGSTVPFIQDYIQKHDVTIIVMGTKGATGLQEVLIGSTAEKIVRNAPCPVLVVKKYVSFEDLNDIVFPNSMEEEQEDLLMHVKALQHVLKATLHLVWVDTSNKESDHTVVKRHLDEFAKRFMLKDYTVNVIKANTKETGIIHFTHSINASMIAMGTHARKGLSHFFKGSVTEDVVNHVDCPIWTYVIKR